MGGVVGKSVVVAVFVCFIAVPAFAQDERVWLEVNFGVAAAAEDSVATSVSLPKFGEMATFTSVYSSPRGANFDFGGGVMVTPIVGVGVNVQGAAHQEVPGMSVRVPHPVFFNSFASDVTVGDTPLSRAEGSFNIQAVVNATPNSERVRVRLFGGPTHFRVVQDTIDDIHYNQVYQVFGRGNSVDITNYEFSESEGTGWGIHGGADVTYFFNRIVGVGGFARFSRGNVELSDFTGSYGVKAGGLQTGGGVRLKF